MDKREKNISPQLEEHLTVFKDMLQDESLIQEIHHIVDAILACYRMGGKVLLFGCGGSAADSQHIAAEFIGKLNIERPSLPAIALTANTSVLTAIGNDYGFDRVFSRQLEGLVNLGDVAIGISTSGKSGCVINGLSTAKTKGAVTVLLTGNSCNVRGMADHIINVPSKSTSRIQEAHITLGHIICSLIEND